MARTCKTCGATYRGLVCQVCHPRGSGERASAAQTKRAARGLDERVPAECAAALAGPVEPVGIASHNHRSVSDELGAGACFASDAAPVGTD